jgi:hypothetical protein
MSTRTPTVLGVVITALVAIGWLLIGKPTPPTPPRDRGGAMFGPAELDALAAAPVDPGVAPSGPDPRVDLRDPRSVAAGYVVAAYSLRDTDAGHTNRRATGYAAPSTPPSEVGVLPLVTPAPGHRSLARVTEVVQLAKDRGDTELEYRVSYVLADLPADAAAPAPVPAQDEPRFSGAPGQSRYLLLTRQFDGRWLVASDSAVAGEPPTRKECCR